MKKDLANIFYNVRKNFTWTANNEHVLQYDGKVIKINEHWGLMQPDARGNLRGDCEDFSPFCSKRLKEELRIPTS